MPGGLTFSNGTMNPEIQMHKLLIDKTEPLNIKKQGRMLIDIAAIFHDNVEDLSDD